MNCRLRMIAAMLALGGMSLFARAAEDVQLPEGLVTDKTQVVFWMDVRELTPERFKQVEKSLGDLVPEEKKAENQKEMEFWSRMAAGFQAAGGEVIAVSSESGIVAEEHAVDAANKEPKPKPPAVAMVRLKNGVTAEAFARDFAALTKQIVAEFPDAAKEADAAPVAKASLVSADGRWIGLASKDLVAPAAASDAAAAKALAEGLADQKGAALRIAVLITADQKKKLAEQMLEPGAVMFGLGAIYDNLRDAKRISVGVFPGENTRIDAKLVFEHEESAAAFKSASDKLIMTVGGLMGLAPMLANPEDKAQAEKSAAALRAMLAPFLLTQEGTTLKTSVDLEQIKRIKKLSDEAKPAPQPPATPPQ